MRIIADDLSGAADAGVAFAVGGHEVRLILDAADAAWRDGGAAVVAADTNGRAGAAGTAARAAAKLADQLPPGAEVLHKVDSTLRGHPAAELAALLGVLPDRIAVVAPAFPRAGRVTRGGVQHVDGVALHESDAWSAEPGEPPRSVAEAVRCQDARPAAVDLERTLRLAQAGDAVVCDAATDDDLDAVVRAARRAERAVLWVGSAGLAAALARSRPGRRPAAVAWNGAARRYLAVVGSASPVARRQAAALVADGADSFELPRDALGGRDAAVLAEELRDRVLRRSVVVTVTPVGATASAAVARGLSRIVAPAAAEAPLLAIAGGATARAVLEQCGVRSLDLVAELEPGVVLAEANGRRIVTKAGAFGDDGTLLRVLHGGGRL